MKDIEVLSLYEKLSRENDQLKAELKEIREFNSLMTETNKEMARKLIELANEVVRLRAEVDRPRGEHGESGEHSGYPGRRHLRRVGGGSEGGGH